MSKEFRNKVKFFLGLQHLIKGWGETFLKVFNGRKDMNKAVDGRVLNRVRVLHMSLRVQGTGILVRKKATKSIIR